MNTSKAETATKLAIMAFVGLAAGRAAFTHMHDWTMEESPIGTPDWFGWSNAVISELIPLTALLDIRAKRRVGKTAKDMKFAITVLVAFVILSLAAQISQATHTMAGWLIAALPAIGFLVVTKLVLGKPAETPTGDTTRQGETAAPVHQTNPQPTPVLAPEPATVATIEPATASDTEPVFAPWAIQAHTPTAPLNGHSHTGARK